MAQPHPNCPGHGIQKPRLCSAKVFSHLERMLRRVHESLPSWNFFPQYLLRTSHAHTDSYTTHITHIPTCLPKHRLANLPTYIRIHKCTCVHRCMYTHRHKHSPESIPPPSLPPSLRPSVGRSIQAYVFTSVESYMLAYMFVFTNT